MAAPNQDGRPHAWFAGQEGRKRRLTFLQRIQCTHSFICRDAGAGRAAERGASCGPCSSDCRGWVRWVSRGSAGGSKSRLPLAELVDLRLDRLTLGSQDPGVQASFWGAVTNPLG